MTDQVQTARRLSRPFVRRRRGIAIAGAVAVTGILTLAALYSPADQGSRYTVVDRVATPATTPTDPLMTELIRCRAMPPQAEDAGCRAAWEENRRHFFGESRVTRLPGDPLPASAPIPLPGSTPALTER